jgi:superfamily I DNA/RNA helicase
LNNRLKFIKTNLSLKKYFSMTKASIIERTTAVINKLPENKAEEISNFAEFIIQNYEAQQLNEAIQQLIANSKSFEFLLDEEDLYTENDIKEKYNG